MPASPATYLPMRERIAAALRVVERRDRLPTRVVIIAANPRSGSTMLARTLTATGALGPTYEVLVNGVLARSALRLGVPRLPLREQVRQRRKGPTAAWYPYEERSMRRYLLMVARRHQGGDGTFGAKIQGHQFANHMQRLGISTDVWGVPVVWIHLRRRDRVAQAVSLAKALQTGQFSSRQTRTGEAEYDADLIRSCIESTAQGDAIWEDHFADHDITPIEVWYEDLSADPAHEIRRLLDALGRSDLEVRPPVMERQFDSTNGEWIERFRRESETG